MKKAMLLLLAAVLALASACTLRLGPISVHFPDGGSGESAVSTPEDGTVDGDAFSPAYEPREVFSADVTPLLLETERYEADSVLPRIYDAHMENAYFAVVRDDGEIRFLVYLAPWSGEIARSESVRAEVTGTSVIPDSEITVCSVSLFVTQHWADGDETTESPWIAELDEYDRLIRAYSVGEAEFSAVEYEYANGFVSAVTVTDRDGRTERIGVEYRYDGEASEVEAVTLDEAGDEDVAYTVTFLSGERIVREGPVTTTYQTDDRGRVIRSSASGGATETVTAEYVCENGTRRLTYEYRQYYDTGSAVETWYEEHGYPTLVRAMEDGETVRETAATYTWSGDTFTRLVERLDLDVSLVTEGDAAGHLLLGGTVGPVPPAGKEDADRVVSSYEYVYDLEGRPLTLRWWTDLEDRILEEYRFDEYHDDEGNALDTDAPGNMNMQRYWVF